MADPQKDSPSDLDFSPEAPLPEEESPYDPSAEERPLLFVQLVDNELTPRAGLAYEISGDGLPETRRGTTDQRGEFLIEDCGSGVYQLTVDAKSYSVHSLSLRDLQESGSAYRVLTS